MNIEDDVRLWNKVEVGDCWTWTGSTNQYGHGHFWRDGKCQYVHRYVWQALAGAVPEGLVIDHLCRNPRCCNPDHLEVVTHQENVLRGESIFAAQAKQTHCKRGHEFTEDNTYVNKRNIRCCRTCHREYERNRRAAARKAR